MPLLPFVAIAVVSGAAVMPAAAPQLAPAGSSVACDLVLESSRIVGGRTLKTYVSRCPGLPRSRLRVSHGAEQPGTADRH
jgi:hypothetical protein